MKTKQPHPTLNIKTMIINNNQMKITENYLKILLNLHTNKLGRKRRKNIIILLTKKNHNKKIVNGFPLI